MKGPSERLKYDLRRVWECPVCKRRERTAGTVTFRHCSCQMRQMDGRAVVMKLVVDDAQRIGPPIVITHESLAPRESNTNEPLASRIVGSDQHQSTDGLTS